MSFPAISLEAIGSMWTERVGQGEMDAWFQLEGKNSLAISELGYKRPWLAVGRPFLSSAQMDLESVANSYAILFRVWWVVSMINIGAYDVV